MTIIPPHKIAIVMDTEFGDALEEIAPYMYVWIVETPANKKLVKKIPQSDWYDSENGISFFTADSKKFVEQQFIEIMAQLDESHSRNAPAAAWTVLEVYGCVPTFLISEVLKSEYRVIHIEATEQGFIATRVVE